MKKFFVLLALIVVGLFVANTAKAQNSGWWIGGKVGYWHDKADNGVKSDHFFVSPEFGYDFNAKWSLGTSIGYESISAKLNGEKDDNNAFIIAPYARYKYFNSGILTLFVDGGFGIAAGDAEGFQIGVSPGLAVKITDRFSFLSSIGYLGYKKDHFNGGGEGFGLSLASSELKFGFFYSF